MPGHASVSSNLLSIACSCAGYQKFSTGILQTQFNKNNLQYPFFKRSDKENVERYNSTGMDALIRTVKGGDIAGGVETCAISFMDSKLSVYPQSTNFDSQAYFTGLLKILPSALESLDNVFDLTLIDTYGGNNKLSMLALNNADVIVVCLPQEDWVVNYFFDKYKFNQEKVFYLFGNYNTKSIINLPTLMRSREYGRKLNSKNSAYIAHDIDFANSLCSSNLVQFFVRGMNCDKSNPNYEYFKSVHTATQKLLSFAGISPRK